MEDLWDSRSSLLAKPTSSSAAARPPARSPARPLPHDLLGSSRGEIVTPRFSGVGEVLCFSLLRLSYLVVSPDLDCECRAEPSAFFVAH